MKDGESTEHFFMESHITKGECEVYDDTKHREKNVFLFVIVIAVMNMQI